MRFIQRTIFSSLNLFKKKVIHPPEIILFDPSYHHLSSYWIEDWISTSDKSYGGTSIAELSLEQMKLNQEEEVIKFLRFQGSMNMTTNSAKSLGVIGGFCAFRGEINSSELLDDYQGFEIICRSGIDTNVVLNMTLDNRTQEDVYQSRLVLSQSETWKKYHIPFSSFRLTLFGRDRQGQGTLEDSSIESIGMLIRNHKGPFRIDIQSIKILSQLDSEFSVESEYKRPNFHRIGSASTISAVVPGRILQEDRKISEPPNPNIDREIK